MFEFFSKSRKKMKEKSLINYIYIGIPPKWQQDIYGPEPRIQLGDRDYARKEISTKGDELNPIIQKFIEDFRATKHQDEIPKLITSIKVHENATMGAVTSVKNELRKNNALKINYSTKKADDNN